MIFRKIKNPPFLKSSSSVKHPKSRSDIGASQHCLAVHLPPLHLAYNSKRCCARVLPCLSSRNNRLRSYTSVTASIFFTSFILHLEFIWYFTSRIHYLQSFLIQHHMQMNLDVESEICFLTLNLIQ